MESPFSMIIKDMHFESPSGNPALVLTGGPWRREEFNYP